MATRSAPLFKANALILAFLGFGALPAGWSLWHQPDGAGLGLRLDWLGAAPFADYRLPGLVLFWIIGVGGLSAAALSWRRQRWAPLLALGLGLFTVAWIGAQLLWLRPRSGLQPLVAALGAAEAVLGAWLWRRRSQA